MLLCNAQGPQNFRMPLNRLVLQFDRRSCTQMMITHIQNAYNLCTQHTQFNPLNTLIIMLPLCFWNDIFYAIRPGDLRGSYLNGLP